MGWDISIPTKYKPKQLHEDAKKIRIIVWVFYSFYKDGLWLSPPD